MYALPIMMKQFICHVISKKMDRMECPLLLSNSLLCPLTQYIDSITSHGAIFYTYLLYHIGI